VGVGRASTLRAVESEGLGGATDLLGEGEGCVIVGQKNPSLIIHAQKTGH
jgi:hypothetical protein